MESISDQRNQQRIVRQFQDRIQEQIQVAYKKKTPQDSNIILTCLKNHFIFYNLSPQQLQNVKENMLYSLVSQGTTVFNKGDQGSCFFIIEKGTVDIQVDGVTKKQLKPLDGFGQLALLYSHARTSSVIAKTDCSFWIIDKVMFRAAIQEVVTREYEQNRKYLQNLKFFPFLTNDTKDLITASLVTLRYYKNQIIVEQGDPGSAYYIIKQGVASLIKGTVQQRKMYKGEGFGQMSLYYNTMRKMTVKADDEVKCLVLGRETLAKILGENFHSIMFKNFMRYSFQKDSTFQKLTKSQNQKIYQNMKISYYKANDIVFKKNSIIQKIIVIFQGRLKKFKSPVILAGPGDTWGQDYLQRQKQQRVQDDIVAQTDMVTTQVSFQALTKSLGMSLTESLKINNSISENRSKYQSKLKKQIQKLKLNQYNHCKELSKLNYGSLHLLERKGEKFVAKVVQKRILKDQALQAFYVNEKQVLPKLSSPFICNFYRSFESQNYYINIFQFVNGMDLYDVIRDIGLLSTKDCQFYVASMILMLEQLQKSQIVIRDLKPENFVVDQKGYLKLVSFGSAKCIANTHKTSTIIGTPHYMPPQMVEGKPYNQLADLWSVGVMLYEFINGYLPFGAQTENPYTIYEQILKGELTFPKSLLDRRAKKVIQQMLSVNPQSRHGGSYANLKSNSWFEDMEWDELYNRDDKKLKIVYSPQKLKITNIDLQKILQNNRKNFQDYFRSY